MSHGSATLQPIVLYDSSGNELNVQDGVFVPANTSGLLATAKDAGGNARVLLADPNRLLMAGDLGYAVAADLISGATEGLAIGMNSSVAAGQLMATTYTEQASAALRSLSSSSANDAGAGTGAQQVTVTGFDNTMAALSETVTLNGATAVATVNSYRFFENLVVSRAGSGGSNAGTITLFVNNVGGGGTIGTIAVGTQVAAVGDNQTFWGHHYVRAGKTCYVLGWSWSFVNVETTEGLCLRAVNPLATGPAEVQVSLSVGQRYQAVSQAFRVPLVFDGPYRIRLFRLSLSGNAVAGAFEFVEF